MKNMIICRNIQIRHSYFGTTYKEWQDKLVIGLDYAGGFCAVILTITGSLFFLLRTKKK
ncbi:MAG: hypothetical protein P8Y79_10005 [Ignavibacteriaceae bacterium]